MFERELMRERERELERELEREIVRRAGRPKAELIPYAAPAISVVVGVVALVALGLPLAP